MTLRDSDLGDRLNTLRVVFWVFPAGFCILALAEWKSVGDRPVLFAALLLLNIPVLALVCWLALVTVERFAGGWVGMVTGAGNLPPAPSFSREEALIARGLYAQAAESFRSHLATHPEDNDARLALARLHWEHLDDPEAAGELYLDVRRRKPTARQEATVSNQLIDLYRKTGNKARLMSELARYADRYPTTRAGQEARRLLQDLKSEMMTEGER